MIRRSLAGNHRTAGRWIAPLMARSLLVSPPFSGDQFRLVARCPALALTVLLTLGQPSGGPALDIVVAPDRRLFEIVAREPGFDRDAGRRSVHATAAPVIGWIQALLREIGRAWLVGLALVAGARAVAFRLPSTVPIPLAGAGDVLVLVAAAVIGLAALTLASTGGAVCPAKACRTHWSPSRMRSRAR